MTTENIGVAVTKDWHLCYTCSAVNGGLKLAICFYCTYLIIMSNIRNKQCSCNESSQLCVTASQKTQVISIHIDRWQLNADQKYCGKLLWKLSAILLNCIKLSPVYRHTRCLQWVDALSTCRFDCIYADNGLLNIIYSMIILVYTI